MRQWNLSGRFSRIRRDGGLYNSRIIAADPTGPAVVGQTVFAGIRPTFLHLKLQFRFVEIDASNYKLGFDARFHGISAGRSDLVRGNRNSAVSTITVVLASPQDGVAR